MATNDRIRFPSLSPENEKIAIWLFDKLSTIITEVDDGLFDRLPINLVDINQIKLNIQEILEKDLGSFLNVEKVDIEVKSPEVYVNISFSPKEELFLYLGIKRSEVYKLFNYSFAIPVGLYRK